jgi:hypothetical protein
MDCINQMNETNSKITLFPTQKLCFEIADKLNHTFFFACDKNDKGCKEYGSAKNLAEFLKVYNSLDNSEKNYYEMIREKQPRYEYYDIDMSGTRTPKQVFALFNSIRMKFLRNEMSIIDDEPAWRITDSSREIDEGWKVSLHIVNKAIVFENAAQTKAWYDWFGEFVKTHYVDMDNLFDVSVCSINRVMRMIGSSKFGQNRPLEKEDNCSKYPMEDFFITNLNYDFKVNEEILLKIKEKGKDELQYKAENKKLVKEQDKIIAMTKLNEDEDEVETLVSLITEKISDKTHSLCDGDSDKITYQNFRNLSFAYVNASSQSTRDDMKESFILTEILPYYRHASQYKGEDLVKNIVRATRDGQCYTIASLHYWAKESENYKSHFSSKKYHATGVFDTYDTYTWGEFKDEIECQVFSSFEDVRKCFIANFNRVCVPMKWDTDTFFIKIEDIMNDFIFRECKKKIDFKVRYESKSSKGALEEKKVKFSELYDSCLDNTKRFNNFGFMPYGIKEKNRISETCFNQFSGFRAKYLNKEDVDTNFIEPILNHIRFVWCDNNEIKYIWVLNWLAHIVQKPHEKTKVMLVLYSDAQQTGKGIIVEWMLKEIIGFRHSCKTGSMKKIVGNFNAMTENRIFIAIDEVSNDEKYSDKEFEKMKTLITDTAQDIEKKGVDAYQTLDCSNYLLMTNNSNAVKLNEGERRTCVLKCNESRAGDTEYFNKLGKVLENEDAINNFYTFLCDLELTVNLKDIPETEERDEMILQTSEQPMKYFACIKNRDYEPNFVILEKKNAKLVSGIELYSDFQNWVNIFSEKQGIYSQLKFARFAVKKLGSAQTFRFGDKTQRMYNVTSLLNERISLANIESL